MMEIIISVILIVLILVGTFFFYLKKKKEFLNEKNSLVKALESEKLELEEKKTKLEEEYNTKKQELKEQEELIEQEEEESINSIKEELLRIDKELTDRFNEIQAMNTVAFECPCNHNVIATFVDLSKEENTFICPECKNEYRIQISMIPILKGKIIDEHNMYNLLSDKMTNSPFKKLD